MCPSVSVCVSLPGTVCVCVSVCLSISVSLFFLCIFSQHEGRTENDQAQTEMLLTEKWQECCATSQSMTNRSRETRLQNAQCANQTVETAGDLGSLTISFCCNWCTHVPKHYFTWFYVEEGTAGKKAKQMTGMCGVRAVTQRQQLRSCCKPRIDGCSACRRRAKRHRQRADTNKRCALTMNKGVCSRGSEQIHESG